MEGFEVGGGSSLWLTKIRRGAHTCSSRLEPRSDVIGRSARVSERKRDEDLAAGQSRASNYRIARRTGVYRRTTRPDATRRDATHSKSSSETRPFRTVARYSFDANDVYLQTSEATSLMMRSSTP